MNAFFNKNEAFFFIFFLRSARVFLSFILKNSCFCLFGLELELNLFAGLGWVLSVFVGFLLDFTGFSLGFMGGYWFFYWV